MASKKELKTAAGSAAGGKGITEIKLTGKAKVDPVPVDVKLVTKKNETEAIMTAGRKKETVPYSVRLDTEVLKQWRTYTEVHQYGDKTKLTEAALTEYMNRHKLTPEQQKRYDTLMDM